MPIGAAAYSHVPSCAVATPYVSESDQIPTHREGHMGATISGRPYRGGHMGAAIWGRPYGGRPYRDGHIGTA
eukprot:COSAG06_NODE_68424_length_227_cov_0.750000_1_plen_71_part_10